MPVRENDYGQPIGDPLPEWTAPPTPGGVELVGDETVVRPMTLADAPALFGATCGPGTESDWTYLSAGPFADVGEFTAYLHSMLERPNAVPMTIVRDGEVAGTASWLRLDRHNGVVEVGAVVFGRALQRTRAATEAMFLMADHVFDLGYRRYEWKCDSLHERSRRTATRLGFRFEGVFRQAVIHKGRTRDTAWFAMTDSDWTRLRPVIANWLDQTIHTESATPPRSLSSLTGSVQ